MKLHTLISSIPLLFLVAFPATIIAQEIKLPCDIVEDEVLDQTPADRVELITAFNPAKTIDRVDPNYPRQAARAGAEGWVQMSYVIDIDGNVQDPVVEDFGGHYTFKRSALRAIKDWKFTPAMKDGKPTEQCHQTVQFDFTMDNNYGATKRFIKKYKEADAFIKSKDYAAAQTIVSKLYESKNLNRYENAWLWSIDAILGRMLGDDIRELTSISRTLASSKSHNTEKKIFDDEYIGFLHQRLFNLQAQSGRLAAALETAQNIKSLPDAESRLKSIQGTIAQINKLIASDEHLFVNVDLQDTGTHFHMLARNKFAFSEIQGQVETVEVRCETRRVKFTVAEDFVWTIPAKWGQCQVMVKGDTEATFDLVEIKKI
ncbi:MAG: TonB family protein [Glaciecola sp.]|jgi:TonB family protein